MGAFWGRFLANVAGLIAIDGLFTGVHFNGVLSFAFAALILGLVNAVIRPLIHIIALPITILTLGLFALVVNGISLSLVAALSPGFTLVGCGTSILAAIILSVVSTIASHLIGVDRNE